MGTTYEITIRNYSGDHEKLKYSIDYLLDNINNVFSTYKIDSEISKINRSSKKSIKVSDMFKFVLSKSLHFCEMSNGSYDITIAPLVEEWGFGKNKMQIIPSKSSIDKYLSDIGYYNINIVNNILYRESANISIDLNSIAKGYAVDQVSNLIENEGYYDFLVEIGGEVKSSILDSKKWVVGIQNPNDNGIIKKINLSNKSMATSGTYNNYFEYKGQKFSHIINPKTGYPYEHSIISATIITNECIDADAFATMAMTMKVDNFLNIVNNKNDVECFLIGLNKNQDLSYYQSDNFKDFID